MPSEEVKRGIEQLSGALVLAEPGDTGALEDIRRRLAEIRRRASGRGKTRFVAIARKAEELVARSLAEDSSLRDRLPEALGHAISALQGILREGSEPREIASWFENAIASLESSVRGSGEPTAKNRGAASSGGCFRPMASACFQGDQELCADFIVEASEHVESIEAQLLVLDKDPRNTEALNSLFRAFHTIKGVAAHLGLEEITSLAHESESLLDLVRMGQKSWDSRVVETVFQAADAMKRLLDNLARALNSGEHLVRDESLPQLLACVSELALSTAQTENRGTQSREGNREKATSLDETHDESAAGPTAGSAGRGEEKARVPDGAKVSVFRESAPLREFVRVDAQRLDSLVETIGEMVTAVSVLGQFADLKLSEPGQDALNEVRKISAELQELGTSLRMVPLRSTFQKMSRCVRDLAREANKKVELAITGEDTELDKSMVERLGDPLLHLMRNAVDHGLEASAEERLIHNKPEQGTIELRAYHQGGSIYIEVEDDGRGLDRNLILKTARARGLVAEEETPSDNEIYNLIFEPGFSTVSSVTSVSGRGVGMDVVKRNIEEMRGSIEIATERDLGTLFTMRLPLTIAIIDGMAVRVGGERYVIPTLSIVRSVRPHPGDLCTVLGKGEVLKVGDSLIPVCRLHEVFEIEDAVENPHEGLIVVVENDGRQMGILIDDLIGQQQIVIKRLGKSMRSIPGIAGGAIMADGRVGLILDVASLARLGKDQESKVVSRAS